ncbi:phage tail spike protein [Listeria sp. SHR_NRA_18]|uniref:phage tail spike protein n=1 Tax=Listeria sp. SHR_NRA_18 TaxID=2269046 RepID=UPI001374D675|nr:phage tail spike protein [Listeria sp. SHR_NRA_18]
MAASRTLTPRLYDAAATDFNNNGIGVLTDSFDWIVRQEANGTYELEFKYVKDGMYFDEIKNQNIVKAKAGFREQEQLFTIYAVSKPMNGIVTVKAEHISYRLHYNPLKGKITVQNGTAGYMLNQILSNTVYPHSFTGTSTSTTQASTTIELASSREALGGKEGSLLDTFKGEFIFDNFNIRHYPRQGAGVDKGVLVAYGKNLTDATQDEEIGETFTSIYPFAQVQDANGNETTIRLPEVVLDSQYVSNFAQPRAFMVDLTGDNVTNVATLRTAAQAYLVNNDVGKPSVNLNISFVDLSREVDDEELASILALETVNLWDTVTVKFLQLGIDVKARVIATTFDPLLDKYISVELGDFKANISRQFNDIQKEVEIIAAEKTFLQAGIDELTNVINNPPAGNVVLYPSMADPQEILIMDTKDINTARNIWRWNAGGLGHSKNGYAGPYEIGMTYDGMIVADRILTGTLKAIDIKGVTITGSAAYLDTLYSSFMPPLPLPQYREILKIGGGSGFSLNAKRDNYPFPAMNIKLNTTGELGFAIEALNETTGAVNLDQVIRLSPYAGAEAPLFYSLGWCYVGTNADGRVAFIDHTTWKSGGGPQIRYVPARASAWETASSATLKQDIEKLPDSILYERFTAKNLVKDVEVFAYRLIQDAEKMKLDKNIGFVAELLPKVLRSDSDDIATVDLYKTSAWLWQYARENEEEKTSLQNELSNTKETLDTALELISDLRSENEALEKRVSDIEEFIERRLLRR